MKIVVDLPEWYLKETQEFKHPTFVDKAIMEGQPISEILEKVESDWRSKGEFEVENEYDMGVSHGNEQGFYEALSMINDYFV